MKKLISALLCLVLVFSAVSFSASATARLTYVTSSEAKIAKVGSKIVSTGTVTCDSSTVDSFSINVSVQSRTRYSTTESWTSEKTAINSTSNFTKTTAASTDYNSTKEYRTKVTITIFTKNNEVVYNYKYSSIYRP